MINPATGVEIPQGTPAPAPATGQNAVSSAAQAGASGKPPDSGQKVVPISAMHEERDKRQAAEARSSELQQEIENLKNLMNQYQPPVQQQYQQPYQQPPYQPYQPPYQQQYQQPFTPYQVAPQPIKEQIDALWQEDIRKGFQAEMGAMMQYRDWVESKVDQEFEASRSRHKEDFNTYESKVRGYVRSLPVDAKAQPNIVEAAYLMVKGQDADNIVKAREAALMQKYQGGQAAAMIPGTFSQPGQASGPTLTAEELATAQAMRMSPEEYLKYRGA